MTRHTADRRVIRAANAQAQRPEVGVEDHILRRQAAGKTQLAHVQHGTQVARPVELEVKVQRRLEARIDRHHAVDTHTHLAQRPFQVQREVLDLAADLASKAKSQTVFVEIKAQRAGCVGVGRAGLPVGPQISLQAAQRGHARAAKGHCVLTKVVQHMLAHAELVRDLQQIFQRATDQRQVLVGQQVGRGTVHLLGHALEHVAKPALERHIKIADGKVGHIGRAGKANLHILATNGDGLVQRLTGAVHRQVHLAHQGGTAQAGYRQAQAGLQVQCIAFAWQDQAHLPVDHPSPLAGHIDCRTQAAGGDLHGAACIDLKAQVGRATEQGRSGLGRIRCAQLHGEGAFGLHLGAVRCQIGHAATLQQHRCQAVVATIAIDIALAEVNHPPLERASARPHVQAQAHAAATERQARHALQAGRSGARLQADKAGLGARVLQQGQTQARVLQAQAHKVFRARALPQLHIDVARRDQGGAQAAPVAVVQRGAAQPHGGQAKAAADAEHIADAQGGIETQAQEFSSCIAEIERLAALRTSAHRQRPLHQVLTAAAVGQVHHGGVGHRTAVAKGLVHLKGQRSRLDLQQIVWQAQLRRIELEALGTGLDRQPAAVVACGRIGWAQQRQRQASVLQSDALHRDRHI